MQFEASYIFLRNKKNFDFDLFNSHFIHNILFKISLIHVLIIYTIFRVFFKKKWDSLIFS